MNVRGKMGGSTNLYVEKVFGCLTRFRSIFTTNIHKDICVQQFVFEVVLTIFRISSVCAMFFDPEGSQQGAVLDPFAHVVACPRMYDLHVFYRGNRVLRTFFDGQIRTLSRSRFSELCN